jgi:outer membrane protein assembly factor BamE (lipoprotein component of BamABCDE complex)
MKRRFFLPLLAGICLSACSSSVTSQSIAQIKPGMKTAEVEALLGRPTHIEESETTGLRGDVYYYPGSHGEGRVIFLNDTVFKAEFVPEGKSA